MSKIEELLINQGLYDSIDITSNDYQDIEKFLSGSLHTANTVDCFCVHCEKNRVFEYANSEVHVEIGAPGMNFITQDIRLQKPQKGDKYNSYLNKRYVLTYQCTRDKKHVILFDLISTNDKIIKIGQYPSVADLATPEIVKYKSVLDKQYLEFSKAVGLFAHGIGIGSFVYLRRIIEKLIYDKYEKFANEIKVPEEEFKHLKFEDKIAVLRNHIPATLEKSKSIYSIVSKGIHELSEEECISMFPIVRTGIELILDDLLAEKERLEKEKLFDRFVANKTGELRQR